MRVKLDLDKVLAVIIALVFLSITIVVPMVTTRDKVKTYEILSDDDFKKYRFEGEGTEEDPYIIENLNAVEARKRPIVIKNTISYFIIRNNFFAYNPFNAIFIDSIAQGTAKIYNNSCIGHSSEGIRIESSDYVEVVNNTCLDNKIGIGLYNSNYGKIENNQLFRTQPVSGRNPSYNSGLFLEKSNHTSVINNFVKNTFSGFELEGSNNSTLNGNYITKTFQKGIILESSSFCRIKDTTVESNSADGIILKYSHRNLIENCVISDNLNGIEITDSNNNQFLLNSFTMNLVGIFMSGSSFENIINLNEISNNTYEGIKIVSGTFNTIHHNSFFYNNLESASQASDNASNNTWFDEVKSEGNYWHGWNTSLTYEILGDANSTDPFPLDNPVIPIIPYSEIDINILVMHLKTEILG
ncbi:MAG: right-handed parallel beta-helix repeat-containing protein [Candidatus Heimdallarchaeaceae archaeon]|jgi:parallel beta-helix repeat protein